MAIYKIGLNEDSNPTFYNLAKEHKSLMDRYNILNEKLHKFRIPRIFLFHTKNKLVTIGKDITGLQKDYLDWRERASNFFINPEYKISAEQKGELIFLHCTNIMHFLVQDLNTGMELLAENYNKRYSEYEIQKNFMIAIAALFLSFIGLIYNIIASSIN